jgi:hypothetical protein
VLYRGRGIGSDSAAKYRDEDRAGADGGAADDRAFLTSMVANVYRR